MGLFGGNKHQNSVRYDELPSCQIWGKGNNLAIEQAHVAKPRKRTTMKAKLPARERTCRRMPVWIKQSTYPQPLY